MTSNTRMDAINSETISQDHKFLKETLKQNKLINSPQQIYNADESALDPKALQGQRKPFITGQAKLDPEHYSIKSKCVDVR